MTDDLIAPAYGDRSLADVLPAVAAALGVGHVFPGAAERSTLRLPEAPSYVVLLLDGLGHGLLSAHPEEAPYLHALLAGTRPATAGAPSTTATSLTSLGTATPPGTHGVVGYTSRIPGTDRLLNALTWSPEVDPLVWQPHPTAYARLGAAGVRTTMVNRRAFAGSGLTVAAGRGAEYVGADRYGEWVVAAQAAVAPEPSLTYLYDADVDATGHQHGVASPQWRAQLSMTDHKAERLRAALPSSTRLLVVADHGMVDASADDRVDVDDHPELSEDVVLVGGEARFRHVYCRAGAAADVAERWRGTLGGRAVVLTRDEGVERGWFGELAPEVAERVGDVLVACRGRFTVLVSSAFPHEGRLVGVHGSLTAAEMLVPVLVG